jgi:SAM-dependent methyltransferase
MIRSFLRLLECSCIACLLAPLVTLYCSNSLNQIDAWLLSYITALFALALSAAGFLYHRSYPRIVAKVEAVSASQANYLDNLPSRQIGFSIAAAAALSLFLELAIIRWQGTVFEFFAFYKNFSLLACFTGLGLGYALAGQKHLPLIFCVPLLAMQMLLMLVLRYGMETLNQSLMFNVFLEQMSMGIFTAAALPFFVSVYYFLSVIFLVTALALVPLGQLCGRLMQQRPNLPAYGLNLLGSVVGVAMVSAVSFLWSPPIVWFSIACVGLMYFIVRQRPVVWMAATSSLICLMVLGWPVARDWQRVYSPYQLLELRPDVTKEGTWELRAAGHYYQRIQDLSPANPLWSRDKELRHHAAYYTLPYRLVDRELPRVAIVGAGTGNDVSAALRSGAKAVDAVEIDPAIIELGRRHHPESPYADPRVHVIVDDARTYLRNTDNTYDMIVYGLLDSHTLLSHASSVRVDSFVYTLEGLREARQRLKPGGVISLSFTILSRGLGSKLYKMMHQVFEQPPVVIASGYDGAATFLQSKEGNLSISSDVLQQMNDELYALDAENYRNNPEEFERFRFRRAQDLYSQTADVDVSTDDWPFFYMPQRVYPKSYLVMLGLVLLLATGMIMFFVKQRPSFEHNVFFFLGVGFMLIETKGITELGLVFGNTWLVIGIMIIGILSMAFLANLCVQYFRLDWPLPWYICLLLSLLVGLLVARSGGLSSATALGKVASTVVLTCPIFFSGLVFSTHLRSAGNISGVMASNLLGAIVGGLLEYNSMYFGFQFLYLLGAAVYVLALLSAYVWKPSTAISTG